MKQTANIISYLLHPLLLPTYAFVIIILFNPYMFNNLTDKNIMELFTRIFFNTFIFPLIVIVIMWRLKFVKNLYMTTQKERILPYLTVSFFFMWTYLVFKNSPLPQILATMLLGASLAVFISFFINIFLKLSMHTVGIGSFLGLILGLTSISSHNLTLLLMVVILISGLVGSIRLWLGSHKPKEIYAGYFVGLLAQLIAFGFF